MSPTSTPPSHPPQPPAPGRGRAAASLPSGHGAPGCGCAPQPAWCGRCGRCGRCALRAALLLPGGRPDALQINAVAFLESGRGRAKRTQTPPVTAAIPCAPHHICLPQQQQQRSERASEQESGGREGARREEGSWARRAPGSASQAASGWRPPPRARRPAARCAPRPRVLGKEQAASGGARVGEWPRTLWPREGSHAAPWSSGPAGRPRPLEVLFAAGSPRRMVGLSGPVQCKCLRRAGWVGGRTSGRAGGWDRPQAGTVNYHCGDRQLRLD